MSLCNLSFFVFFIIYVDQWMLWSTAVLTHVCGSLPLRFAALAVRHVDHVGWPRTQT